MPISAYLSRLRQHVGSDLILMPAVGALVHDASGRVLLEVASGTGKLMLPGGAVDPGESPREALVREVYEETSLVVQPTHLVAVVGPFRVTYPNGDQVEYTSILMRCEQRGGTLGARDGECAGFRWVLPGEVPPLGYPPEVFRWRPGDPVIF